MTDSIKELVEATKQLKVIRAKIVKIVKAQELARGTRDNIKPFYVGDEGPNEELRRVVEMAIRARGMTLNELEEATGARRNRISAAIVKLQRDGVPVVNEGNGYRAIWRIR